MNDYLKHYGVLGMKWGVRRYQNEDGTYTSAGKKHYGIGSKNKKAFSMKKTNYGGDAVDVALDLLSDPYVALVTTLITAEVATYTYASGKHAVANILYKNKLDKRRQYEKIDPESRLHLKSRKCSIEEDLKQVNPNYETGKYKTGTYQNCVYCTYAFEMRRRGFDVSAKLKKDGTNAYIETKKLFIGARNKKVVKDPETLEELYKRSAIAATTGIKSNAYKTKNALRKEGNSRGELLVGWPYGGGHSMAYEVQNGNVVVYDAQIGKKITGKDLDKVLSQTISISYTRLDNVKVNKKRMRRYMV